MFKTDKASLEALSFILDERELSLFYKLLSLAKREDVSTLSLQEIERVQAGLRDIAQLKLEGKVYAFHIEDAYAERQGPGAGSGVELYLRQGNRLEEYLVAGSRDYACSPERAAEILRERNVHMIYTGPFVPKSMFLTLPQTCDEEDPLERNKLSEGDLSTFFTEGIEVHELDELI